MLFDANADVFYCLASLINDVTFDLRLRLPRHCSECEQDGDDGLLVHYSLFFIRFEPQSYRKSHEKAPDMTEKVSAEVKV